MLMAQIMDARSHDLSDADVGAAIELAEHAARLNWRTSRGTVHSVDPSHQATIWLGVTFYCGLGLDPENDEATTDGATCRNCWRAWKARSAN